MRKVPETVAEVFELAEELLQREGAADILKESEAQAERMCKWEEELCNVGEEVNASKTKVKESEKSQQEAESSQDDTFFNSSERARGCKQGTLGSKERA